MAAENVERARFAAKGLSPPAPWRVGPREWDFSVPLVMGVINVTPDSFSDGGCCLDPEKALERALQLVKEGADIIDIGGASSHPSAPPVDPSTELERVAPVVERLGRYVSLPLSIDTVNPGVAEACLKLGAHLINDVSGLNSLDMAEVATRYGVPLVITHNGWALPPRPSDQRLMDAIYAFFRQRIAQVEELKVKHVIVDPGYGFGKTLQENLTLLRSLNGLVRLRKPILICTSRKGSLGRIVGEPDPRQRLGATVATSMFAAFQGAAMIRVHDVKPFRQAQTAWRAIKSAPREI